MPLLASVSGSQQVHDFIKFGLIYAAKCASVCSKPVQSSAHVMMTCRDLMPIPVKMTHDIGKGETKSLVGGDRLSDW